MYTLGGVLNHYPRHVGDITLATFGLSFAEFGCYDRLLDAYYDGEAPLPLDPGELYRTAAAKTKADRAVVDYIVLRYFVKEADGWHNKRADEEIAAYQARADTARRNGHFGGRPANPQITESVSSGLAKANPAKTIEKANQEPVTSNQNQEPELQTQKPKVKSKGAATPLPDWVPPKAWEEFRQSRRAKRNPLTARAEELAIAELGRLRDQGHDVQAIIDRAILKGWSSFYAPNESRRGGLSDAGQRTARSLENWAANEEEKDKREAG